MALAVVALAIPVGATANDGGKNGNGSSFVSKALLDKAKKSPGAKIRVIIQSQQGVAGAERASAKVLGKVQKRLSSAGGVALEVPASVIPMLQQLPGLTITIDSKVALQDLSGQPWTSAQGFDGLWSRDAVSCATNLLGLKLDPTCVDTPALVAPQAPAIAIVDSGVENRADFAGRLLADVKIAQSEQGSTGDSRGHGTMVAGIAAGAGLHYVGGAPNAPLVSLDVIDASGAAYVSDVIAAIDWIIANKAQYNIRVANFSLGAPAGSIRNNPLNDAVERLWLSGVVVVASAGNYAVDGAQSNVKMAPANDPFVITVGATDVAGTADRGDDYVAPFSAWGHTADGFSKPDLSASGRYMVGPVPATSALVTERPGNLIAPDYMRLSGTSFAAPAVSAAAAQVLARHPEFTPDQVKGALMYSAKAMPLVSNRAGGVGELDVAAAASVASPPNPNAGLNQFLVTDPATGAPAFDEAAWAEAAWANAAWNEAAWAEAAWAEAAWAEAAWSEAAWAEAAWAEAAWAEDALADNANE